ncbi:TetR family transcriptional regulator [Streptomyces benahoarensis]|uniref:TetR family transcriptional regulator n=1 Tax=Streptomyces benahoarensis TaxID=2595054 RepID=A0A553XLA3_9ACTN|nr:TetR family transcriptional regulator [Streptomyces benahoarensis]TSB09468.1 TetR family transcriptional regulator [Streptomyces benahoarensis]TSB17716.1 TetR family transcriptional regulator [Streptomyces benahoarensis]
MSHTVGVRQAQKQRTRQALLDAALGLLEEQSLSSLGLREVTRTVGIAPTAFYRHFRDLGELGVALVEEALGSLHAMVRTVLIEQAGVEAQIDSAVAVVDRHVREYPAHVRFVARERHGGVRAVRQAIAGQLDRFGAEVAEALTTQPTAQGWGADDLRKLADLFVDRLVTTAAAILDTEDAEDAEAERARVVEAARWQIRLITIGQQHWRGEAEEG